MPLLLIILIHFMKKKIDISCMKLNKCFDVSVYELLRVTILKGIFRTENIIKNKLFHFIKYIFVVLLVFVSFFISSARKKEY